VQRGGGADSRRNSRTVQVTFGERLDDLASRCDNLHMALLAAMLATSVGVNSLLIVAACNDRLWSWSGGYLLSASVLAALITGAAVLMLP
jgi:hypothetical protein